MKQTFIICLESESGITLEFERWPYKRVETCIRNMIELYKTYKAIYIPGLVRAAKVTAYPTPDGYHREAPVWSVTAEEFLGMILKEETA